MMPDRTSPRSPPAARRTRLHPWRLLVVPLLIAQGLVSVHHGGRGAAVFPTRRGVGFADGFVGRPVHGLGAVRTRRLDHAAASTVARATPTTTSITMVTVEQVTKTRLARMRGAASSLAGNRFRGSPRAQVEKFEQFRGLATEVPTATAAAAAVLAGARAPYTTNKPPPGIHRSPTPLDVGHPPLELGRASTGVS